MGSASLCYLLPNDGQHPMDLHTAASIGCEERVRDIIENLDCKEAINSQNRNGWTPIMYAAYCAELKVVVLLLEEGADTNMKNNDGYTSLILATKCGSTDVANLLIENGAFVNEKDSKGWSALFHATSFGHRSVVQLLVERGALVNLADEKYGLTPLMLASAACHEMIVKDLLQYGANPTLSSKSGETARCIAIRNGHMKVKEAIDAQMFLRRNYIPNSLKSKDHQQQSSDLRGVLEILELTKYYPAFVAHGIDIGTFWMLCDEDLKEIGIELLGPRKKLTSTIARWHQNGTLSGNSEEKAFANKLILDNQKLQKHISELNTLISQEKKQRLAAENNLAEGIQTLKTFSQNVQRNIIHTRHLQEQLKESHRNLNEMLTNNFQSQQNCGSWSLRNVDVPATLFIMGELIDDISNETSSLLQQINFKSI